MKREKSQRGIMSTHMSKLEKHLDMSVDARAHGSGALTSRIPLARRCCERTSPQRERPEPGGSVQRGKPSCWLALVRLTPPPQPCGASQGARGPGLSWQRGWAAHTRPQLALVLVGGLPKQLGPGRCFSVRPFPGHKPPIGMWQVEGSLPRIPLPHK